MSTPSCEAPSTRSCNAEGVWQTNLDLPGRRQGKVRDVYQAPEVRHADGRTSPGVVIVASDRLSAFDVVLPTPVTGKGKLLTSISAKWFEFARSLDLIPDHVISTDPACIAGLTDEERALIAGRVTVGRTAEVIPIEFVVRGYLAGSGWVEYQKTRAVCGIGLPAGLTLSDKLPEPIFTPATKATEGHDENVDFERASSIAGEAVMTRLRDVSIKLYEAAADYAAHRGIILADTKFEFGYALDDQGRRTDEIILIDEIFTPDSSRFWPADQYEPGREQESFDKQYVRNHLLELVQAGTWDKTPPGPELPEVVVQNTIKRYEEARRRLWPDG